MSNDNSLVDEYEKLQNIQKEISEKLDKIKERIIALAQEKNTDILFGTSKKCSIKEYEKVVYPEDKTLLIEKIKVMGLYEQFSSLNYFKLSPKIIKGEIDKDIIDMIKKEKAFRISLRNKGLV